MGHLGHSRKSGLRQEAKLQPRVGSQVGQAGSPAPFVGPLCCTLVPLFVKWGHHIPCWGCQEQDTYRQLTLWE